MSIKTINLLIVCLTFSACAASPDYKVPAEPYGQEGYDPALKRAVIEVAKPLLLHNADLCPSRKTVKLSGQSEFEICNVVTAIYQSNVRNAHIEPQSDGSDKIWLSSALVQSVSRDELAFLIAHELGHRVAGHDIEGGSSPRLELQADAAAQYLLARAGFDLTVGEALIQRLNIGANGQTDSHPAQEERLKILTAARIDIESKQRRGEVITPPRAY